MRLIIDPNDWVRVSTAAELAGVTPGTFSVAIDREGMEVLEIDGIRFVRREQAENYAPKNKPRRPRKQKGGEE
jgi:hypothetical protein